MEIDEMSDYMKCRCCGSMFSSVTELEGHEIIHQEFEFFADFLDGKINDIFWNDTAYDQQEYREPEVKRPRLETGLPPAIDESSVSVPRQRGGGPILPYSLEKVNKRTLNNWVIDRHYKMRKRRDEKLSNLNKDLTDMSDKVLDEASEGLKDNDLVRVIVHHPDLQNPIYVPLQRIEDMTADTIMEHVENVLNSHQDLAMDDGFFLDVGTMELPKGDARTQINSLTGPDGSQQLLSEKTFHYRN
ncbi:hypothetical protein KUTeg_017219 [Tegillarca granosa]|uniref:C2H2-type domain-containing protein n=1 Tax=Tegillarca granosa TaxID=220873 RepID=A0ABQ9EIV1_TEGGR|nr:hypothetical protein KUTeg_017219 [Tegillarca granosa]